MSIAHPGPDTRSLKQRVLRACRRTRKAPVKVLLRLEGYDNSQPILLEPFRAIYFQIPKIASSSLKARLRRELGLRGIAPHCTRFPAPPRDRLETGFYSDYFKFCFVRNPWARLVSCYHSKIVGGRNINHTLWTECLFYVVPRFSSDGRTRLASLPVLNGHMSFAEFVDAVANIPDEYADKHFRSQHTFLCSAQGELLVDYVGRLESFRDDFQHVAQRIGLGVDGLEKGAKKKKRDYREYYDQTTWETVSRRYRRDIDLLGYQDCRL